MLLNERENLLFVLGLLLHLLGDKSSVRFSLRDIHSKRDSDESDDDKNKIVHVGLIVLCRYQIGIIDCYRLDAWYDVGTVICRDSYCGKGREMV